MRLPLWRRRQDDDLREEIATHLRMAIADRVARGETAKWTELDPAGYKDKAAVVAAFKKAAADLDAALKALPATRFASSPEPWLSVTEHTGEHYGQLVVYYRLNKLVPPRRVQRSSRLIM